MMHAPWYNSNVGHRGESLLMQSDLEELLFKYGVDIVLNGHVHAYERTYPVYKFEVNPCGPVNLNLGDGGNREGAYVPWVEPQPAWSAFREGSFGVGKLVVKNATHAYYEWDRQACEGSTYPGNINFAKECQTVGDNSVDKSVKSDSVWITRPLKSECPFRHREASRPPLPVVAPSTGSSSDGSMSSSEKALLVLFLLALVFLGLAIGTAVFLMRDRNRLRVKLATAENVPGSPASRATETTEMVPSMDWEFESVKNV